MYKKETGNDKQGKDARNRTLCPYGNFSQAIMLCKTWLLGENSVQFLTFGQIWSSLLPIISCQFYAFFSYVYTLKHKDLLIIRKHWWHLQAEQAFINTKCMKIGYNRIHRGLTLAYLFWSSVLHCFNSCNPGIIYGPISSRCMGVASR